MVSWLQPKHPKKNYYRQADYTNFVLIDFYLLFKDEQNQKRKKKYKAFTLKLVALFLVLIITNLFISFFD